MFENQIFAVALAIDTPWYIKDVQFDSALKRLDIYIYFKHGSRFSSTDPEFSDN